LAHLIESRLSKRAKLHAFALKRGAGKGADTKRKRGTSHPRREGPGCGAGAKR